MKKSLKKKSNEDEEFKENEIRSNLRYCWQRAMAYALEYKPTIQEVKEELEGSFLAFIPINNSNRREYQLIISQVFNKILGKLFTSKDVTNIDFENEFIELAIRQIKNLLN